MVNKGGNEVATLGGGCFWCLEPVFNGLEGVERAVSGYAGGSVESPSYQQVVRGDTGHAEVVQVTFDPNTISFREILEVFFAMHDPTTLNRQGADTGPQYRSLILYHGPEQESAAAAMIEQLDSEGAFRDPIVTEVRRFEDFYEAEEYHQNYYEKNPNAGYCLAVIAPKMQKFRKRYGERLKERAPAPN